MKLFRALFALMLLAVLVLAGGAWLNDPGMRRFGQVIVQAGGHDYVATLPKAGLILLIVILLLWLLWMLLAAPLRLFLRYRRKRARARLLDGLTALHHGRWQEGEKLLLAAADDDEAGPLALAAALRAADKRADEAAAASHLQRLQQIDPLRHALLQARRLIVRGHPAEALALLDNPALQPLPPRGHVLRQRALATLGQAEEAYGLLGTLRSQQALPAATLQGLERQLAAALLAEAADTTVLANRFEALGKTLQAEPEVAAAYARRAIALGWHAAAAHVLGKSLQTHWSPGLLPLLVATGGGEDPLSLLAQLRRWLDNHPDEPALLLATAEMARHQGQTTLARELLQRATTSDQAIAAWEALGRLHAQSGKHAAAAACFGNALNLRDGLPLADVDDARPREEPVNDAAATDVHDGHDLPRQAPPE